MTLARRIGQLVKTEHFFHAASGPAKKIFDFLVAPILKDLREIFILTFS
jgi:hypothetical protein